MKKNVILSAVILLMLAQNSFAFWIWTPETNKWVNPKYAVKDTPKEQFDYAKGSYDAKDYKKAIAEFDKLIRNYPRAREAAEAQLYIGMCLEEQGKLYEAFKAYQKTIEKYPFSERFAEVVEREYRIGEKFLEGEGKKGKFVSTLIGGEYNVVEVFRDVIKKAPYGKYAAPSQYKIGLYLQEKELYQEARDEFEKVINDYPDSEWVKAAKYQIALVDAKRAPKPQYEQKTTQAAAEEFKEFVSVYPDAELSQKAQKHIKELRDKEAENNFVIARFYEKQKDYKSAKIYYNLVLSSFQDTRWAVKALERIRAVDLKHP